MKPGSFQPLIVIILILAIAGVLYMRISSQSKSTSVSPSPTVSKPMTTELASTVRFVSQDGSFQFEYQKEWTVSYTTPKKGRSPIGAFVQSWTVTTYDQQEPGTDGIPVDSIKMDFEILNNDTKVTLDTVIECQMKSTDCTTVTINGQKYKKDIQTLNTGTVSIALGTIKGNTIYRVVSFIQTGPQQEQHRVAVEKILQTIKILR